MHLKTIRIAIEGMVATVTTITLIGDIKEQSQAMALLAVEVAVELEVVVVVCNIVKTITAEETENLIQTLMLTPP